MTGVSRYATRTPAAGHARTLEHRWIFIDGAWDPEKGEFEAGAGVVEFEIWPTTEHAKLFEREYFDTCAS